MIEKLLKALFVKTNGKDVPIPKIHNLLILADKANMQLTEEQKDKFVVFNTFQISARYQDYKSNFYKKCTKRYSMEKFNEIKELRKWLKNQI